MVKEKKNSCPLNIYTTFHITTISILQKTRHFSIVKKKNNTLIPCLFLLKSLLYIVLIVLCHLRICQVRICHTSTLSVTYYRCKVNQILSNQQKRIEKCFGLCHTICPNDVVSLKRGQRDIEMHLMQRKWELSEAYMGIYRTTHLILLNVRALVIFQARARRKSSEGSLEKR